MLTLLLAASLTLPLPAQDDAHAKQQGPSQKAIEATLASLEVAFKKSGTTEARLSAIEGATRVVDAAVIDAVARRGLRSTDVEVRRAAIDAMGWMRHPRALKELHGYAKKKRKQLTKDWESHVALLKAIGRHGDPSSIPVLTEKIFASPHNAVIRARILALGNIRSTESVEELMSLLKVTSRQRVAPQMPTFRTSLMILTGVDQGLSQQLWMRWWNDNKKKLEVAQKPHQLPEEMQRGWDRYWGNPRRYERSKKRGERGQDPEKDGRPGG